MSTRIYLTVKHEKLQAARGRVRPSDLARVLEVSPQVFATYESGSTRVPAEVLLKWCAELKLKPATVIEDQDKRVLTSLLAG